MPARWFLPRPSVLRRKGSGEDFSFLCFFQPEHIISKNIPAAQKFHQGYCLRVGRWSDRRSDQGLPKNSHPWEWLWEDSAVWPLRSRLDCVLLPNGSHPELFSFSPICHRTPAPLKEKGRWGGRGKAEVTDQPGSLKVRLCLVSAGWGFRDGFIPLI